MSVKPKNEGKCFVCQNRISHMAATRHMEPCLEKASAHEKKDQKIYLLKASGGPSFWMYIEVQEKATLTDLDQFLRQKWMECCGHLSTFDIRGQQYFSHPEGDENSMDYAVGKILEPGMRWSYEYDFGSTTEVEGTVLSVRTGHIETMVKRVARNYMPHFECEDCDARAEAICSECGETVCEDCAEDHECGEEMLLSTCNSPRMGMCGFEGENDDDFELEELFVEDDEEA